MSYDLKPFVRHEPCPKCGSKDNVSVYWNEELQKETKYCNTPGCDYMITDKDVSNGDYPDTLEMPYYKEYPETIRGITKATLTLYHVGLDVEDGSLIFPYEIRGLGKALGWKRYLPYYRDGKKVMLSEGSVKHSYLFGKEVTNPKRKVIILTEGELDAMSAYQMTEGWNTVSIPCGASSAEKAVKANLKYLESFEKVFVCFDNDEPGRAASEAVMKILKPLKGYEVILDEGEDANSYLMKERTADFMESINRAKPRELTTMVTGAALWEGIRDLITSPNQGGFSTGFDALEGKWQIRPGEVTTVLASTSVGKSSFCRQLAANAIAQDKKVVIFSYEEAPMEFGKRILCMRTYTNPLMITGKDLNFLEKEQDNVLSKLMVSTSLDGDLKAVEDAIEYAYRGWDADMVIYDNLSGSVGSSKSFKEDTAELYGMMTRVSKTYGIHSLIVSHVTRDKDIKSSEIPTINHAYGSSMIGNLSDNIIALAREGNITLIAMLKQRISGELWEAELTFDTKTYTYNGCIPYNRNHEEEVNDQKCEQVPFASGREIRQHLGEERPRADSESSKNTQSSPTTNVQDDNRQDVQSRFPDTLQSRNSLRGSQGTTRQADNRNVKGIDRQREEPDYSFRGKPPTEILKKMSFGYRVVGQEERDSGM